MLIFYEEFNPLFLLFPSAAQADDLVNMILRFSKRVQLKSLFKMSS